MLTKILSGNVPVMDFGSRSATDKLLGNVSSRVAHDATLSHPLHLCQPRRR